MYYSFSVVFFYGFWFLCFLVYIFWFSIFCYWHCKLHISPRLVISKICFFFFPLPIVFSILSIMLQAIFQKLLVVVVVVFFYLLILKGPMFLPGLVFFFPQKQVECLFVLDSPCSLGHCQRSPQRGQAEGQDASSMSGIWRSSKGGARAMGHTGKSPHSWFLSFSGKATLPHARPNVSDLLPGTQV